MHQSSRHHGRLTSVIVVCIASALTLVGAVPGAAAGAAATHRGGTSPMTIEVIAGPDGAGFTLSADTAPAGRIKFNVDSANENSADVLMFKPSKGNTPEDVFADFRTVYSGEFARGVRALDEDAEFYGLAGVVRGHPASVIQDLRPGTYYLFADFAPLRAGGSPEYATLRVKPANGHETRGGDGRIVTGRGVPVSMTQDGRFTAPRYLPAHGTISVRNASHELHEMNLFPVKTGTTSRQVQAWLDAGAADESNPFIDGPSVGLVMISGGRHVQLSYDLPAGTYLMFCEVPDEVAGTPHVFMGMWKVVTLR